MPFYDLKCECKNVYEVFVAHKEIKNCECPECGSKKKKNLITGFSIGGPTAAKMGRFNYRAGYNMEKAKGDRRAAEAGSHMGTNPYQQPGIAIDDMNMGEGVHHPFPLKKD